MTQERQEQVDKALNDAFGRNPLEEAFPGNPEKQWITAALVGMASLRGLLKDDDAALRNIDTLAQKAPLDCLITAVSINTTMNAALSNI